MFAFLSPDLDRIISLSIGVIKLAPFSFNISEASTKFDAAIFLTVCEGSIFNLSDRRILGALARLAIFLVNGTLDTGRKGATVDTLVIRAVFDVAKRAGPLIGKFAHTNATFTVPIARTFDI